MPDCTDSWTALGNKSDNGKRGAVCLGVFQCRTVTKAQAVPAWETVTNKLSLQTSEATIDIAKSVTKGRKMPILFDATATPAAVQASGFLLEEIFQVSSADPEIIFRKCLLTVHFSALLLDWWLVPYPLGCRTGWDIIPAAPVDGRNMNCFKHISKNWICA